MIDEHASQSGHKGAVMVRSLMLTLLFAAGLSVVAPVAHAQCMGTPFECAVDDAINRGLQWYRASEAGQGHFSDAQARHNFLGALSFLEKREGVGWNGRAQGYNGMDANDQQMIVRLVLGMINQEDSMTNAADTPYVYVAGGNLIALSAYIASGGGTMWVHPSQ